MTAITTSDMIHSALGRAAIVCLRQLASKLREHQTLQPDQIASFLHQNAELLACSIYEETFRQMQLLEETSCFTKPYFGLPNFPIESSGPDTRLHANPQHRGVVARSTIEPTYQPSPARRNSNPPVPERSSMPAPRPPTRRRRTSTLSVTTR